MILAVHYSEVIVPRDKPACSISLPSSGAHLNLPLVVNLVCTSAEPVKVDFGPDGLGNLRVYVQSLDHPVDVREFHLPSLTGSGRVEIGPATPYEKRLNLSEFESTAISEPFRVTLVVLGSDGHEVVSTNTLDITLGTSSEELITKAADRLAHWITTTVSFDDQLEYVSELGSIKDSRVVPVVGSLLGKVHGLDAVLIDILASFNSAEARKILASYALRAPDREDTEYARAAQRKATTE